MNKWGGELFDPSTTPALRATPPVPGCAVQISQLECQDIAEILGIFVSIRDLKNDIPENLSKLAP
jgi:hypothetical protein